MKNLIPLREAGSLIAGLLIGVSIVVPVFAMTVADAGDGETAWVIVAPVVLALGLILQVVVTRPRQRRMNDRELAASRIAIMELSHAR